MTTLLRFNKSHPGRTALILVALAVAFWIVFVPADPVGMGVVTGVTR